MAKARLAGMAAAAATATTATVKAASRPAICRSVPRVSFAARPSRSVAAAAATPSSSRAYHTPAGSSRPRLPSTASSWKRLAGGSRRTIFIQTESTPNGDALKFLPNHRVLPEGLAAPYLEYLSPRATVAPPYPSPLAARLLSVDGVTSVFYGGDFITVTKAPDANWAHIRPEVFALITEAVTSGEPFVKEAAEAGGAAGAGGAEDGTAGAAGGSAEADSLQYDENDSEVVGMIKELLETRIRPAIQEDGGDIEFRGFVDGQVLLKLRGACRTCDSSTVTLKNGIESMLMHYIEEVQGVTQVLDREEEVALEEFAKFEEKLRQQKGGAVPPAPASPGTLGTAAG